MHVFVCMCPLVHSTWISSTQTEEFMVLNYMNYQTTTHSRHSRQWTVDSGARKRIEEQQMIATAALLQLMSNPKKTNKRNAQMMDINGHVNP